MPVSPFLDQLDEALDGWERSWNKLRGRWLFITGGTGFIGTWMLEVFCRANRRYGLGARIRVLTRDPEGFKARAPHLADDPAVSLVRGDVRTFRMDEAPVSLAIHAATASSGTLAGSDPLAHLDTIVQGTRQVLDGLVRMGAERLLYLSSGAVYGTQPPDLERIDESYEGAPDLLDPTTLYAQGKRMAEHLCTQVWALHGIEPVIGRGFAFVGPGLPLDAHFAIGNFIGDLLKGRPVLVRGDGTPFRSYLYATDMALAFWLLLLEGRAGNAYNVGSPDAIQIGNLARLVASQADGEVQVLGVPVPGRQPSRYVPSIEKLRHDVGFQPRIDLSEGIRRTIYWHQHSLRPTHPDPLP